MRRCTLAIAAAVMLPTLPSLGAEYMVPYDFPTIQSAIDGCAPGDEIVVIQGTFNEALDFRGKALTLRSLLGPEATTISGAGLESSVLSCVSGEGPDTIIEGFTISGKLLFGGDGPPPGSVRVWAEPNSEGGSVISRGEPRWS